MKKTLGLALGSSGSRGISHLGFLKALDEEGIKPDYIVGSSMGSIVGAAYAAGIDFETMKNAFFKLRLLDFISPTGKRGGLFSTAKMRKLLEKYLGDLQFEDLKMPFRCVAVDMRAHDVVTFSEGSVLDAIVASSCIPAIFRPMELGDMRLIDGGVLERVPARQVKEMGADVVVAVDALGQRLGKEKMPGTMGILLETIEMMDYFRTQTRRKENADIIDFWLEPALGDMSQYSLKQKEFAYEKGYELGKEYAKDIAKALS